jgi:hypothetical protein
MLDGIWKESKELSKCTIRKNGAGICVILVRFNVLFLNNNRTGESSRELKLQLQAL